MVKVTGPLSYYIKLTDNRVVRRHVDAVNVRHESSDQLPLNDSPLSQDDLFSFSLSNTRSAGATSTTARVSLFDSLSLPSSVADLGGAIAPPPFLGRTQIGSAAANLAYRTYSTFSRSRVHSLGSNNPPLALDVAIQ